jgi:hypothetical protein
MSGRDTTIARRLDARGEALASADAKHAPARAVEPAQVELPLAAWRRRSTAQSNVITLRIPSWASSSSNP